MRLELTGHQLDITPALRRLVSTKLVRLERLMSDTAVSAQVVLSIERAAYHAEMTLHARGEKFLHSAATGDDFQAAVGGAIDKLVQQGQTVKGKWQERRRRPARVASRVTAKPGAMVAKRKTAKRRGDSK